MAKLTVKAGSTSRREYILILDSTSTAGAGDTGLVFNTSGLKAYYVRPGGSATAITLATQTVTGSYSSGGFVEVDATNMPGIYRFDIPDAVFAAGVDKAIVMLSGATNMAPVALEYDLVAYDPMDTVRLGLTALPNVASGSAGAIITSGTGTAQLSTTSGNVTVGTNNDKTGYSLTQAFPTNFSSLAITAGGIVSANTTQWGGVTVTGMPMPTYTQPTGFLAATFPATVASTTNITSATGITLAAVTHTGATIPTVTTVTNAVTAGTVSDKTGYSLSGSQTFSTTGSVGSVTGSVGSVTGAVGSVTSAVTVGTINANVITAASIATDAIDSDAIAASAVTEIQTGLSTLTSGQVENAVWDASFTSHTTAGTYGGRLPRSDSSNVEVKLTGSAHIAADIHEVQPGTFVDADYDSASTYAKLATLIEADPVSGYRYTTQALEQAPAGGGGGGGSTTVRMGPFEVKADGAGADQPLDIQKGATHGIDCTLVDGTGTGVDITGATLSAKVYNSAGTLVETLTGTATYAAAGQLTWTITTTTTGTAGTYTATITRTTGASDTQVFGPLRIYVREV